jgi:hypothetical protein
LLYSPLLDLDHFFSPWVYAQYVRLLKQTVEQKQCRHINNNTWSGIRTHDIIVLTGENRSCFRSLGHCDGNFSLPATSSLDFNFAKQRIEFIIPEVPWLKWIRLMAAPNS